MKCSLRLQKTFCCCCSLKVGTLVIATLGCVLTLIQFIFFSTMISSTFKFLLLYHILCGLLVLISSILLIVAVYKKNNKFMLPWLVILCLGNAILAVLCLIPFALIFFVPNQHAPALAIIFILLFLLCVYNWYCWLVVWSHYMELNDMARNISPNVEYRSSDYVQESLTDDDSLA